jgi:hypothetical protein
MQPSAGGIGKATAKGLSKMGAHLRSAVVPPLTTETTERYSLLLGWK